MSDSAFMWAYIDPASGAILIQAIVAGILTAGVAFRRVLLWPLHKLLGRKESRDLSSEPVE